MTTVTTRRTVATPIDTIFAINDTIASKALAGLTAQETWQRLTDRSNPMLWIAGHLVQTRTELLALLGDPFETGLGNRFTRGATLGDPDSYPSREEVERTMRAVAERLHARLSALDDMALVQPPSLEVPGTTTLADHIAGFALHDCYHVGQMGFIRKALGYEALAG
jgi:DinB superfamily